MSAARTGDPDAWDTLFRRYQLPLFTFVVDLVRNEQTALDLVQDAFLAAIRHLPGLRDNSRFGSWLFGIAHQRVVQHWRHSGRSPFIDAPLPESDADQGPTPDLRLVDEEDRETLLRAVDALSPEHRCVVLLHYLEDFPLAEIATITGTSLGTVKSRLHYARCELRRQLAPNSSIP